MCLLASGCSFVLEHHRALGVVADATSVVGAGLIISGEVCDRSTLDCVDKKIAGDSAGAALLVVAAVVGVVGLGLEMAGPPAEAPHELTPLEREEIAATRSPKK